MLATPQTLRSMISLFLASSSFLRGSSSLGSVSAFSAVASELEVASAVAEYNLEVILCLDEGADVREDERL